MTESTLVRDRSIVSPSELPAGSPKGKRRFGGLLTRCGRPLLAGLRCVIPLWPLSWRGAFALPLLGVLVWLLLSAQMRMDRVMLTLCEGGLVLAGVMMLLVILTALRLRFRREPNAGVPWRMAAGSPFRTGYHLGFAGWNPLIRVELTWEKPEDIRVELVGERGRLVEEVTADGRALCSEVVRRIVVQDIFGLVRFRFRRKQAQDIYIQPNPGQVQEVPALNQYIAGDAEGHPEGSPQGDPIDMRRYSPGDPMRLVLWKVYARTRRLVVRTPERAFSRSVRAVSCFIAGQADESTAGIVRAVLEKGLLGPHFLFGADGADILARTVPDALDQLVRSVNHRGQGAANLDRLLEQAESLGTSACVLFVPARPGEWLDRVAAVIGRHRGPFATIIGVESLSDFRSRGLWHRLLFRKQRSAGCHKSDVAHVSEKLRALGVQVQVIDRNSGSLVELNG